MWTTEYAVWGEATKVLTFGFDALATVKARVPLASGLLLCLTPKVTPGAPIGPRHPWARRFLEAAGALGLDAALMPVGVRLNTKTLLTSDMDGTLLEGDPFEVMAKRTEQASAYEAFQKRLPTLSVREGLEARAALLKGATPEALAEATLATRARPGVARWSEAPKPVGATRLIVTSGFVPMAEALSRAWGWSGALANCLLEREGRFTGEMTGPDPKDSLRYVLGLEKANALRQARDALGATFTVAVGDTGNDVPMLEAADWAIAVGEHPAARAASAVHLLSGDYGAWVEVLEVYGLFREEAKKA